LISRYSPDAARFSISVRYLAIPWFFHHEVITLRLLSTLLGLPLVLAAVMPSQAASGLSLAERDAIVQTVTQAAAAKLKLSQGALRLTPDQPKHSGDWVFLMARMRDAAGQRFDYAGTSLHKAAQAGTVSDLCVALLRREGGVWKLIEIAVGPTDVAWETWPATHNAPAELFK
jgi:hypothetical protein